MYVIVTTNKKIADEARKVGSNVFEVSETNKPMERLAVKEPAYKEDEVIEVMRMFAFKPNLKGYDYIKSILEMCVVDKKYHQSSMTKVIYPGVAKEFDTSMSRVERAIRHSIERSFEKVPERYEQIFNIELNQQPTNSEFISMMSEYLAHHMA